MIRFRRYLPMLILPFCLAPFAAAQSLIDFNVGFGAAQAKASSTGIETGQFTFASCTLGTVGCSPTPDLKGFNMGFGVNLMLWKHFGVGMEATMQPGKQTYVQLPFSPLYGASKLQSRVTFYDFNGIYQPVKTDKAALQLIGGVGGTNMRFYQNFSSSSLLGNYNGSQYASSSNHFNLHAGVGVQVYVSGNIFVRPEFDLHYVPNFEQFGTNLVKQEMVWIGYTIGERQ